MKESITMLPKARKIMEQMGENIKLARRRRNFSTTQVAERAGLSRGTVWQIENGSPSVSLGNYFMVLFVLNLEKDFLKLAEDDQLGRKLQDAGLITKKRAPKRNKKQTEEDAD
ncbi:helix-turn-helix domain-containing protein [Chitinophaga sp. sic0106]|uniref:helix-turn-helix domain-containing protein n=1 Tax=Chitinophaga sp. sic0106 TaxID=2854785 RepID=UPI001C49453D|nr:helix-turn-helix transcriptional regulator [Chitinophaga sp. sic0106]MBV7531361.1 helix-turn-helix domain-containing protein [Chitinophaga sp. sic0106]